LQDLHEEKYEALLDEVKQEVEENPKDFKLSAGDLTLL